MRASQVILYAVSLAVAHLPRVLGNCGFNNATPQWKCNVCNSQVYTGSAPLGCFPFNATFDDIAPGPLAAHNAPFGRDRYLYTNWTNFDVVADNSTLHLLPHVPPYSPANYAKIAAGKTGVIEYPTVDHGYFYDVYSGALYGLHFACALPLLGTPVDCHVNVTSYCQNESNPIGYNTAILNYTVGNTFVTPSMTYAAAFDKAVYPRGSTGGYDGACINTTLTAVSTFGTPVDLFVDDLLFFSIIHVQGR